MASTHQKIIATVPLPSPKERLRLIYLDGIRGLAALYVVFVHCWNPEWVDLLSPSWVWQPIAIVLRYGMFAVVIFIVLSGYCLMLPVARGKRELSGGFRGFYRRRIRRILPPYYAAILIGLLISGVTFWVEQNTSWRWHLEGALELEGLFSPYFSGPDLLSYLLLLQNFELHEKAVNGSSWTIAIEWQIYFLFAALLIPIWQRYGLRMTVAIAFIVGVLPLYVLPSVFDRACFWFLGVFALGMAAADIGFSARAKLVQLRRSIPWAMLGIGFSGLAFVAEWLRFRVDFHQWMVHALLAIGVACFLVAATRSLMDAADNPPIRAIVRFLESRWIVGLGTISYSLYLIHAPVVFFVHQFLLTLVLIPVTFSILFFVLGVSFSLAAACGFYWMFERPFLSQSARSSTR